MTNYKIDTLKLAAKFRLEDGYYIVDGSYSEMQNAFSLFKSQKIWEFDRSTKEWKVPKDKITSRQLSGVLKRVGLDPDVLKPGTSVDVEKVEKTLKSVCSKLKHIAFQEDSSKFRLNSPILGGYVVDLALPPKADHTIDGKAYWSKEPLPKKVLQKLTDTMVLADEAITHGLHEVSKLMGGADLKNFSTGFQVTIVRDRIIQVKGPVQRIQSRLQSLEFDRSKADSYVLPIWKLRDGEALSKMLEEAIDKSPGKATVPASPSSPRATARQVDYAKSLALRVHFVDAMGGKPVPHPSAFENMTAYDISNWIDAMKDELR
jgi:hypothetical protein